MVDMVSCFLLFFFYNAALINLSLSIGQGNYIWKSFSVLTRLSAKLTNVSFLTSSSDNRYVPVLLLPHLSHDLPHLQLGLSPDQRLRRFDLQFLSTHVARRVGGAVGKRNHLIHLVDMAIGH